MSTLLLRSWIMNANVERLNKWHLNGFLLILYPLINPWYQYSDPVIESSAWFFPTSQYLTSHSS